MLFERFSQIVMCYKALPGAAISSPFSESTAFVLTPMLSRLQFGNYADAGPLARVPQGTHTAV